MTFGSHIPGPERPNPHYFGEGRTNPKFSLFVPIPIAHPRASDYSEYQSDTCALFLPYVKPLYLTAWTLLESFLCTTTWGQIAATVKFPLSMNPSVHEMIPLKLMTLIPFGLSLNFTLTLTSACYTYTGLDLAWTFEFSSIDWQRSAETDKQSLKCPKMATIQCYPFHWCHPHVKLFHLMPF